RSVQQVDLHPVDAERRQRERDRALLALLGLVEVAHRGAVLDATGPVDRPGRHEQGLRQGGLAGSGVADQDDVADRTALVGRRTPALASRVTRGPCACAHARPPVLLGCPPWRVCRPASPRTGPRTSGREWPYPSVG